MMTSMFSSFYHLSLLISCLPAICGIAVVCEAARGDILRFADTLISYQQGSGAQSGYTDPTKALGCPTLGHSPNAAVNDDPVTWEPTVVSLGQGGSITLRFNTPVRNQPASIRNPFAFDLLIWGNAFQGGQAITPEYEFGRFEEQGFVEVAAADENGLPIEWFLILPRIHHDPRRGGTVPRDFSPAELLLPTIGPSGQFQASGDLSVSASRFDGFADTTPMQGSVLQAVLTSNDSADVVLDDPGTYIIEGLGGDGVDLSRAVRQDGPGVPDLSTGQLQFHPLARIDLIRITDARIDDMHGIGSLGPITSEVDGIIVLPDLRDCHNPFADADGDGDVDQVDFGIWQTCYTGGNIMSDQGMCSCFDRDGDGNVDAHDLAAFEACAATSGPTIPADKSCDGM